MDFKDYFSKQAQDYSLYRPTYPDALFSYLNDSVNEHKTAWDCGTGNGQVALSLTPYFDKIYASDASENQIKNAVKHPKIDYFVSVAESTSLEDNSLDLITVAQAAHWFNLEAFYQEVKRVLKPDGIIAMWCYGFFNLPEKEVNLNLALQQFYEQIEPYWPPERQLINEQYKTISFPFQEISAPEILMQKQWTIEQLVGYLSTWSSTHRYILDKGEDTMINQLEMLVKSVSSSQKLIQVSWPIYWRIGYQ